MDKRKEYEVGETFVVNGQTYKVVESWGCGGCILDINGNCMNEAGDAFGSCSNYFRKDGKSVKFVKVVERKPLKVVKKQLLPLTRCVEMTLENGEVVRLGQCRLVVCIKPNTTCAYCKYCFSDV